MIEIYFDFISPYAYLAWTQVRALGERTGRKVEPRPVLFAAMLNTIGTFGPAERPARRAYTIKDVIRAAHRAGVPLAPPPAHPFNPLPALRVAASADASVRFQVIDALYAATWAGGGGIDGEARVQEVPAAAGLPAIAITDDAKRQVRENTDEALARGAFGVPTLFVDGEMFFGFTSFPEIEAFVRGEDPVAAKAELIERWATLPAAATRTKS
jgi:2-hydroxychromene-2-carboxylate isomerase